MTVFVALLTFTGLLLKWALGCLCAYVPLRLFNQRFPVAGLCFSILPLLLWLGGLFFLSCLTAAGGYEDGDSPPPPPAPFPFAEIGLMWGSWLGLMLMGAAVMRFATEKKLAWGHGFLFCTLYLTVAYCTPGSFVFFRSGLGYAWNDLWRVLGVPTYGSTWNQFSNLLGCLFPLGVPVGEAALRSFRRVWQSNQSGSFV